MVSKYLLLRKPKLNSSETFLFYLNKRRHDLCLKVYGLEKWISLF